MAEREVVADTVKIEQMGMFDLEQVYKKARAFLETKGYTSIMEEKYVEKIKPTGKQLEIKWKATKETSDYFHEVIELMFLAINLHKVEVEQEGKKFLMDHADLTLIFTAYLLKNAKNKWKERSMMKKIYEGIIVKSRIVGYKKDLYDTTYGMMDELKLFLDLYRT